MLTYKYNVDLCVNGVKLSVILPFLLDWRYAPSLAAFLMETRLTVTRKHKSCDRPPQGTCRANSNRKNTGALSLSTIYLTWKPKHLLKKLNRLYYQLLIPLLFHVKKTAVFTFRGIYIRKQRKSTSEGTKADRRRRKAVISKRIYFPQR